MYFSLFEYFCKIHYFKVSKGPSEFSLSEFHQNFVDDHFRMVVVFARHPKEHCCEQMGVGGAIRSTGIVCIITKGLSAALSLSDLESEWRKNISSDGPPQSGLHWWLCSERISIYSSWLL